MSPRKPLALFPRLLALLWLLFLFLVSIKMLESSIKLMGEDSAQNLFLGIAHPLAGLAAGILATVLVQSSSVSTSTIVALVGSGTVTVETAVPMIMGANIGTTITNTLVSLGTIARRSDFRRAFAAATVHDFFNLLAVAVLLPLQVMTGFLSKTAAWIGNQFSFGGEGESFKSPLKAAVQTVAGWVQSCLEAMGLSGGWEAFAMMGIGLGLIFLSLSTITRLMKVLIAGRAEKAMNRALKRSGLIAIGIGALLTMAVQSSSITTSLLVPLCSSGVLTLENAFPVMLGANIGTTITAFLASLATDRHGLEIALVHMMFNLIAVGMTYPIGALRRLPIRLARTLSIIAVRNKIFVAGYVMVTFVLVPMLLIFALS